MLNIMLRFINLINHQEFKKQVLNINMIAKIYLSGNLKNTTT